ncbi:S41 family peptidase [Flavitalea sp. BT771]|uniref:S41 family peptidase n=1 Tax=Flavitalea sp. BT771 TaxID=3063329 RepID=UPI0026E246E3|nr:S41 family peptidase [Flavitalea sp. BT771]MDO6429104.1 S41 family peptidase [Flavitalea sp. BT771]MDV6218768.1 S41 family peptidase [Flavitalea sp. BT771]
MRKYLPVPLIVIIFLFLSCDRAHKDEGKLSVKEMKADLGILWSAVKELHPGYGLYASPDSIHDAYNTALAAIDEPMYEGEFISRIYPFLCTLGCGHTQLRHSANHHPPTGIKTSHLPFEVLVHGERAWVTTRKTNKLATGDEILSINDTPVADVIRNGYSLYCGDGHVASFKELYLSEYDGFDDVCNMHYKWSTPYRVAARSDKGLVKTIVLDSTDTVTITNTPVDKYASWDKAWNKDELGLYFSKDSSTVLFEVKGLAYEDTVTYGKLFAQVAQKRSGNLILDMRHNGGGDIRIVTRLLSYLADTSFAMIRDLSSRIADPSTNSQIAYFDPEKTVSFKSTCVPGAHIGNTWHMDVRPEFCRPYGPNPVAIRDRFKGKLYVLIDGATFSSAALFTTALKAQRKDVVFIGRETAGTEEGCNGFSMQQLTLPNSHIVIDFPWLRVISMAPSPPGGRGLMPDYPVAYSPEDAVKSNDPDLAKALDLVEENKKRLKPQVKCLPRVTSPLP